MGDLMGRIPVRMNRTGTRAVTSSPRSALDDFLQRAVAYENAGAELPRRLLGYAALGATCLVATAALFAMLPDPQAAHRSGLLLIGKGVGDVLLSIARGLVLPLAVVGVVLLVLDGVLFVGGGTRRLGWHYAVAAQPFVGGVGLGVGALLLALVVINVVIWLLFVALLIAAVLAVVALMALLAG
jgi:hypothetical protein